MTTGQLKKLLANVPDDLEVTIVMRNVEGSVFHDWNSRRVDKGWKGAVADLVDPLPKTYDRVFHCWVAGASIHCGIPGYEKYREFRIGNGSVWPMTIPPDAPPPKVVVQVGPGLPQLPAGKGVANRKK